MAERMLKKKGEQQGDGGDEIDAALVPQKIGQHHQVHGQNIGQKELLHHAERGGGGEGEADDDGIEEEIGADGEIVEIGDGEGPEHPGHQQAVEIEPQEVFRTLAGVLFEAAQMPGEQPETEIEIEQMKEIPEDQPPEGNIGMEKEVEGEDDEELAGKIDPGTLFAPLMDMAENLQLVNRIFLISV